MLTIEALSSIQSGVVRGVQLAAEAWEEAAFGSVTLATSGGTLALTLGYPLPSSHQPHSKFGGQVLKNLLQNH
jgi:hypothetical protein